MVTKTSNLDDSHDHDNEGSVVDKHSQLQRLSSNADAHVLNLAPSLPLSIQEAEKEVGSYLLSNNYHQLHQIALFSKHKWAFIITLISDHHLTCKSYPRKLETRN